MGLIRKEDLHESLLNSLSNPNLLINGDFQVWQRGLGKNGNNYFDCTNSNEYTADRFMVSGEQGTRLTVEKQKGSGMKLVFSDHTLNTSNIRTYFDRDDILRMVGKTYTFSVEYQYEYNNPWSNEFHLFSYPDHSVSYSVIKLKKIEVGLKQIRLEVTFKIDSISDNTTKMHIQWLRSSGDVDGFGYHIIRYIKLEEGPIATKFISRSYGEELALCQRYYENGYSNMIASSINFLNGYIKLVPKRVVPTVKIYSSTNHTLNKVSDFLNGTDISTNIITIRSSDEHDGLNGIHALGTDNGGLTTGTAYVFSWTADAEIY